MDDIVKSLLNYCCSFQTEGNIRAIFKFLKNCGVGVATRVASEVSERTGSASHSAEHWFKIR